VIEPTIIPSNVEEFKIKFDKIWVTKPEITEADGSKRKVYPPTMTASSFSCR